MFASLLVANRGEIACRIFRTARRMGIKCIAVYSQADARAKHVREADEAYLIGPAPAAESYLAIPRLLEAAKASGAAAIHPGYGFLSENAEFAEAVAKAGLIWVGPTPASIRSMGLKDEAKRIAEEAGAPVVPGYRGSDQDERVLREAAKAIGFPVLIKAIAGGGGRGIREVRADGEFTEALASARREAKAAFGDDRVLIEKLIERPRHIEVQVFGDKHGHLVHLFERDCSLQRRRQKVIEEAPAPGMTPEVRAAMTDAALKIARAVNYENAGTVEFIVEGAPRADNFYFMEMNTRLQVEHPVTEAITGVDLVEWQLRVAAGETLPLAQDELAIRGHAIEARLCAEDPAHDFRPSVGRLIRWAWPAHITGERDFGGGGFWSFVDSGFDQGDVVSSAYDSLLAKFVSHADVSERDCRTDAINTLRNTVFPLEISGVETNAFFLGQCLEAEAFRQGGIHVGWIAEQGARLWDSARAREVAALILTLCEVHATNASPWSLRDGWRLNGAAHANWLWETSDRRQILVDMPSGADGAVAKVNGRAETITSYLLRPNGRHRLVLNDRSYSASIVREADRSVVFLDGAAFEFFSPGGGAGDDTAEAGDAILAPLPGKLVSVTATVGAAVTRGQTLALLEAMKMEHALTAPRDGVVAEVPRQAGAQVRQRDLIVRLVPL